MTNTERETVIRQQTKLRVAYELLTQVWEVSTTAAVREVTGQDDPQLEASIRWIRDRLNRIQEALQSPATRGA